MEQPAILRRSQLWKTERAASTPDDTQAAQLQLDLLRAQAG